MPARVTRTGYLPGVDTTYTVTELNRLIARAIERTFPDEVWVSGEIRNLNRAARGHVYFSLIDADAADPAPQLPVVLFSSDREAVNRALIRVSAGRMVDGMQVRVRGTVGHQATRGVVQLRMRWIDTDYTLGRLAADRRAVLEGLATEGLLDRQAGLALPVAPRRIGLVTSPGSAAHGDFLHELTQSGFGFTVLFTPVTVQGVGAAGSIASALSALEAHRPDVVAVVRGGGSQTDLAVFDSDVVARAVATASFPVLTGIGHEVDQTVADRVAARAVKTPTACAQLVVGMVRDFATRLSTAERNLRHGTERVTVQARRRLDHITPRLGSVTSRRLTSGGGALDRTAQRLRWSAAAALEYRQRRLDDTASAVTGAAGAALGGAKAASSAAARRLATSATHGVSGSRRRLDALAALVKAQDPDLMLARGWTVTRTAGGLLVRSPEEVSVGDEVVTTTAGGDFPSVVGGPRTVGRNSR